MTHKKTVTFLVSLIAIAVVVYFFIFQYNPFAMNQNQNDGVPLQSAVSANSGVVIQDIKVGTGAEAVPGTQVSVNYIGKLQDGTIFDQSSSHGGPFSFALGAGQVIPGWEQGISGMKVGGERILIIPPALAYGNQQIGPIPPNSTLIFDVTLLGVSTSTSR